MTAKRHRAAPNGPETDKLTERQRRGLAAMLTSRTLAEAAKKSGLGERTLKTYRALPAFQMAYREAQQTMLADAINQSRQTLSGALTALVEVAADEIAPPAARVSAARACVELSLKLGEQADLLERVTALEKQLGGEPGANN